MSVLQDLKMTKKKFYKCYASYKYILSILILLGLDSSNSLCGNNVKIKTRNSITKYAKNYYSLGPLIYCFLDRYCNVKTARCMFFFDDNNN